MKTKTVVGALIRKNNKLLTVERARGLYTGMLGLPGGHLEENESEEDALVREVKEETGLDIRLDSRKPIFDSSFNIDKYRLQIYVYRSRIIGGKLKRQKSEVKSINWSSADEFLKSLTDNKYPENEVNKFTKWLEKERLINEN